MIFIKLIKASLTSMYILTVNKKKNIITLENNKKKP